MTIRLFTKPIVRDTGLTAADAWVLADDWTEGATIPTAGYAQQ